MQGSVLNVYASIYIVHTCMCERGIVQIITKTKVEKDDIYLPLVSFCSATRPYVPCTRLFELINTQTPGSWKSTWNLYMVGKFQFGEKYEI
jgi:hypothetical protein